MSKAPPRPQRQRKPQPSEQSEPQPSEQSEPQPSAPDELPPLSPELESLVELTEAEWAEKGRQLGQRQSGLQWDIGEWWMSGEIKFRTAKAIVDAEDWTGPAYPTCVHAAACCRKFPSCRRRQLLSFSHHATVLSLPMADADALLDLAQLEAEQNNGKPPSVRTLRHLMMARKQNYKAFAARMEAAKAAASKPRARGAVSQTIHPTVTLSDGEQEAIRLTQLHDQQRKASVVAGLERREAFVFHSKIAKDLEYYAENGEDALKHFLRQEEGERAVTDNELAQFIDHLLTIQRIRNEASASAEEVEAEDQEVEADGEEEAGAPASPLGEALKRQGSQRPSTAP